MDGRMFYDTSVVKTVAEPTGRIRDHEKQNPPNRGLGGFFALRPQVSRVPPDDVRAAALHERPLQLLRLPWG